MNVVDGTADATQHPSPGPHASPRWLWWVVGALVAWHMVGYLPVGPVECDSVSLATFAEHAALHGRGAVDLSYNFAGTSGAHLVLLAARQLTGLDAFAVFTWLSVLASLGCLVLGALLIARLLAWPVAGAVLLLLAFQETMASGYYPNSNVLAALPALGAAVMAQRRTVDRAAPWRDVVVGGALFGLAGWLRADVALLAPVLVALLWRRGPVTPWLARVGVLGVVAGVVAVTLLYAGGSSIARILATAGHVLGGERRSVGGGLVALLQLPTVMSHVAFLPVVALPLLPLGLWALARTRRPVLAIALAGMLPLWAVMARALTSPKGIYYLLPYAALTVGAGLAWLWQHRARRTLAVLAVVEVLQLVVGVRVSLASKPWAAEPTPTLLTVWSQERAGPLSRVAVTLGAGTVIPTDDGPRLASGTLFAPWLWRQSKSVRRDVVDRTVAWLNTESGPLLPMWALTCDGTTLARWSLTRAGFTATSEHHLPIRQLIWTRGSQRVDLRDGLEVNFDLRVFGQPGVAGLYAVGSGREQRRLYEQGAVTGKICGFEDMSPLAALQVRMPE